MKKHGLFFVTLVTLLFSGLCMARAGWFSGPPVSRASARISQVRGQAKAFDPMASQAAWRYRRGQASNWRMVLLYR